jgi:hypothetical protein
MSQPELATILTLVAGVIVVVVMMMLAVTDFFAFVAFSILIGVITFVLYYFGFVTFKLEPRELDITYNMDPFAHEKEVSAPAPVLNEVFYISDNKFTYDQAPLVCRAYGAEIASYAQVEQAYNSGAEWCGYGWSEGGVALFPTQQATWDKMQKESDPQKRIKCGRAGINGGYFDPKTKFGVNCYGLKPTKPSKSAVPSTDPAVDKLLAYLKKNLDSFVVQPFNQTVWSEKPVETIQASQTATPSAALVPGSTQPSTSQTTTTTSPSAITSTQLSAPATTSTASASAAAGSVRQAPPASTTTSSTTTTTTGTNPMGVLTDTFNSLGSSASNFVSGL